MGGRTSKLAAETSVVAGTTSEGEEIRRSSLYPSKIETTAFPEVKTAYDMFQRGLKLSADRNCLGYRTMTPKIVDGKEQTVAGDFKWMTYKHVAKMITDVASGVMYLNLCPPNAHGDRMAGIFSKNRYEWVVSQQALFTQGLVSVPLYDTLGEQAVSFILGQTGLATVFCSKLETPKLLLFKKNAIASSADGSPNLLASLLNIVQFEDTTPDQVEAGKAVGITVRSLADVIAAGTFNPIAHNPPKPTDKGVICYTSGTTGNPKGVVLTHGNLVADASAAFWAQLGINQADVHLSYLPLAHVFEQLVENALLMCGASMGFFQGDTLKIMEDIQALRPTLFPSVPRLFNRIYDKIMGGVNQAGGVKAALFKKAYDGKKHWLAQGHLEHSVWDKLVFGKVKARVGLDRCRLMVSGSAPLAAHVMEFMRIVFGCAFVEGYGQTECSGAASVTPVFDQVSKGHVGVPLACNEIKLVSVPDMGYLITDKAHGREVSADGKVINPGLPCRGRGEVCYRGTNIFSGYYLDEEKTREALDSDGWLHSGDIGLWDAQGFLRIIDRKKNIFKLSQGEYVAAEKIENVYLKASLVGQVFVYGDSLHSMLVGIVVPDPDQAKHWASTNGRGGASVANLCSVPEYKKAVHDEMIKIGKEAKLQGFEQVKDIHLEPEMWQPGQEVLTPTFKIKRADAKKRYQTQIDTMYAKLDPVAGMTGLKQGH